MWIKVDYNPNTFNVFKIFKLYIDQKLCLKKFWIGKIIKAGFELMTFRFEFVANAETKAVR